MGLDTGEMKMRYRANADKAETVLQKKWKQVRKRASNIKLVWHFKLFPHHFPRQARIDHLD